MTDFDQDGPGMGEGLFGIPDSHEAAVAVIAVPWEATASYGRGTANGPKAIEAASQQVDLFDLEYGSVWKQGISWFDLSADIEAWNREASELAIPIIAAGGVGEDPERMRDAARVDILAHRRDIAVCDAAIQIMDQGRIPVVLGGDHSSPLGLLRAVGKRHPGIGILHIDAHADLRGAYLGFRSSHASIMRCALQTAGIGPIVGVGYRDVGESEVALIKREEQRVYAFTDPDIAWRLAHGSSWLSIVEQIIAPLPEEIHISFDIDGLDPSLCPNTGTPVPGGLGFRDVCVLLRAIAEQRRVISFDLCEVSPRADSEWDANVGARILYKLAGCSLMSRAR
jgi:agmatinase